MIASYNPAQIGDVLVVVLGPDNGPQQVTQKQGIVEIKDQSGTVIGYNFFDAQSRLAELAGQNGQIQLNSVQVQKLNQALQAAGFSTLLPETEASKFVVGYVKEMKEHPKSSHLHITTTEVEDGKTLQIVSGSPNMQEGIKVVVAEVGAMMPAGLIIWPSTLKDVESDGMICSGRELRIPNAPDKPGALILPDEYQVGQSFDFKQAQTLFSE
ncbi:DUF4479 and tRNA-binding domain-containing protein [Fructilactobacillus hinvesii]|uniref:DUF4479 and tRNA-binding domain-containing protein n=1 Tax=Fructilactobacillus hinvesii TaxID=2940300 RepID=A0ABY5BR72_9LACO|nr:DUF4479 and tRNA-binding domain-containing protein [Fructilactobacillus hinvesii]USS87607.1 DUF4479 and tRNA-binding domain-containing protein [Fructilactobacillus hinvesii]